MPTRIEILDWGVVEYQEALVRQRELFEELVERKREAGRGEVDDEKVGWLVFCQHPHVYTIGRNGRGGVTNLLASEEWLARQGVKVVRVDRGGDITYHGPGQVVVYPVLDLEKLGLGLREYIELLEECVIDVLAEKGIAGERVEGKTGVWVKRGGEARKICAIGVRASRNCVMHGLALNVATDLKWFEYINPCGMAGCGVTSVEREMGVKSSN